MDVFSFSIFFWHKSTKKNYSYKSLLITVDQEKVWFFTIHYCSCKNDSSMESGTPFEYFHFEIICFTWTTKSEIFCSLHWVYCGCCQRYDFVPNDLKFSLQMKGKTRLNAMNIKLQTLLAILWIQIKSHSICSSHFYTQLRCNVRTFYLEHNSVAFSGFLISSYFLFVAFFLSRETKHIEEDQAKVYSFLIIIITLFAHGWQSKLGQLLGIFTKWFVWSLDFYWC